MSFTSFPVEQLGLSAEQERQCVRATASDILLPSRAELARRLGRGEAGERAAQALIDAAQRALMPRARRASALPPPLDVCVEGTPFVCRAGAITEIVGESAAGKSHLTLSLAVAAQLPALCREPGSVLVLTSERALAAGRLRDMGAAMLARHAHPANPGLDALLDGVEASAVADADSLEHALAFFLPPLLARRNGGKGSALLGEDAPPPAENSEPSEPSAEPRKKPVRLLILDSLAALLRAETALSGGGLVARSRRLCAVADRLKALAVEYALAVVVVNQVSDVFADSPGLGPEMRYAAQARHFSGETAGGAGTGARKEAALGIVWANCVNCRIMLARTGRRRVVTASDVAEAAGDEAPRKRKRDSAGSTALGQQPEAPEAPEAPGVQLPPEPCLIRRMHQVFSAFGPPGSADFVLAPSGVHVLRGSYRLHDLGPALRRRAARMGHTGEVRAEEAQAQADQDGDGDGDGQREEYGLGDLPDDFWDTGDDLAVGVVE